MGSESNKIHLVAIHTLQPATKAELKEMVMELTPWDLVILPMPYLQRGLLYSKPEIQHEENLIDRLIKSFSRTLDDYVPLAGRLATKTHLDDDTLSFYVDCNVIGAEFIHATAEITLAELLDSDIIQSLFPLNGVINYEGIRQPLFAVQVTELVDGMFIGCSMNHVIGDGTAFWRFMNFWSEISRSSSVSLEPPIFTPWFVNETDLPVRFPSSVGEKFAKNFSPPFSSPKTFHFTQQKLTQIKLQANAERGDKDKISTLQALLGHVWITTTRARRLDPDQEVKQLMVAGTRTRVNPPLTEEHFGNYTHVIQATAKAGELLDKGLGWAAWLLNQAVTSLTNHQIHSQWESFIKEPLHILGGKEMTPKPQMVAGSSPRFDVYGNDFGWGRPIAVRSGCTFDGLTLVHPGAIKGSLDVELSLVPEVMTTIADCNEFTEIV